MNPFLKHPILQFVGYEMMKKPTLKGIRADLKKVSNKDKWSRIFFPLVFIILSIKDFLFGTTLSGIFLVIISIISFYVLQKVHLRNLLRFKISDEDILEQIDIHKKWSNNDKFQKTYSK